MAGTLEQTLSRMRPRLAEALAQVPQPLKDRIAK